MSFTVSCICCHQAVRVETIEDLISVIKGASGHRRTEPGGWPGLLPDGGRKLQALVQALAQVD